MNEKPSNVVSSEEFARRRAEREAALPPTREGYIVDELSPNDLTEEEREIFNKQLKRDHPTTST